MRIFAVILTGIIFAAAANAQDLEWVDISKGLVDVRAITFNPAGSNEAYIGTGRGIFKNESSQDEWREVLNIKGHNKAVNFLFFDQSNKSSLYAATGEGLFCSLNSGKSWNRIFRGKNSYERDCTAVNVLQNSIFLGTKGGLFVSKDKGRSWYKEPGQIGKSRILTIVKNLDTPSYVYVACVDGVFSMQYPAGLWEKIFAVQSVEFSNVDQENTDDFDEEERSSIIKYIAINKNNLYLATSLGVYQSQDRGKNWQALPDYGLLNKEVKFLFTAKDSLIYAVCKSGVFKYLSERWQELSFGLAAEDIRALGMDNQGNLYAACDKGLFRTRVDNNGELFMGSAINEYDKDMPAIRAVQQAAIKYAEVQPEKIMEWRKKAAKKALLPQVNVGVGRDVTDLWHWETGSTTKNDDDVLVRGQDALEWDVSLSWDLGEVIWNNDQTSIDTRSRLMVQLRDDILDEVNKLYFESLRVKMELDNLSIEDRKKRLEKELRLKELIASLDGLTNGYFSQQIKNRI